MTTTPDSTNETGLAVREFSDRQIRTRLDVAAGAGFGLQQASKEQLNAIYLLARHYDLDPLTDITLFQGRPWFTIDGRVRMMRRHPEYRGYRTRPLSKDEKDAWGYAADEVVVECTIRTKSWGDIIARGKVRPGEFNSQPVAKAHPQEMAEKRAIARCSRMAFGQDVPDDEEVEEAARIVIEERNDPERIAAGSALYDRTIAPNYDEDLPMGIAEAPESAPVQNGPSAERTALLEENDRLGMEAATLGVKGLRALKATDADTLEQIAAKNVELMERTRSRAAEADVQGGADERQATAF